jgi:hypothetical protein
MKMLGKILYYPCYFFGKCWLALTLRHLRPKIWPRNSFSLNRITILKSDIDLTIFFNIELSVSDLMRIKKTFLDLKFYCPLFAEINIYDKNSPLGMINYCELNRDPNLKQELKIDTRKIRTEQQIVFLLHMLYADRKNLRKKTFTRQKKWQGHLNDLNIPVLKIKNQAELLQILKNSLFSELPIDFLPFMIKLFNLKISDINSINYFYKENLNHIIAFILISPALWIGASIANERFESDIEIISKMSIFYKKIIYEHLAWEISGLSTQRHLNFNEPTLKPHLLHLNRVLEVVKKTE